MSEDAQWDGPSGEEPGSIYDLLATDQTMEQQGIVLNFGKYGQFKIARAGGGNQLYNECRTRKFRPYAKQQRNGSLSEEVAQTVLVEVYAETIVKGWTGVLGRDRKPLPFSLINAKQLMTDIPQLFDEIRISATDYANFQTEEAEEAAGN